MGFFSNIVTNAFGSKPPDDKPNYFAPSGKNDELNGYIYDPETKGRNKNVLIVAKLMTNILTKIRFWQIIYPVEYSNINSKNTYMRLVGTPVKGIKFDTTIFVLKPDFSNSIKPIK